MKNKKIKDNGFVLSCELETFLSNDAAKISRRNFFTFKEEEELVAEALVEIRTTSYDPIRIAGDRAKYDRTLIHHALVRAAKKIADERSEWTRDRDSLDAKLGDGEDSASHGDFITDDKTLDANGPKAMTTPTRQVTRDLRNPAKREATLAALASRDIRERAARERHAAALEDAAKDAIGAKPVVSNAFETEVLREEVPDIWRDDAPFKVSAHTKGGIANTNQLRLDQYIDVMWILDRLEPVDRQLCELVLAGWEIGDAAKLLGISPSRLSRTVRRRLQTAFAPICYILGNRRK